MTDPQINSKAVNYLYIPPVYEYTIKDTNLIVPSSKSQKRFEPMHLSQNAMENQTPHPQR
jgi:hypothetical protein